VRESGAVRFPAVFGNTKGQMTAVVIRSETEDAFWCVNAWGSGKAADLAEKTASKDFLSESSFCERYAVKCRRQAE